jgi:outer membrane protein assembly factor BamD (BamD/ComL family)
MQEGEEDVTRARFLMSQGLFKASLRESQEVLRRYPQSQGDQALFLMGLIYLHPQNPNVDYQKSLGYFQRLEREFPDSQIRSEAEAWISLLQKSLRMEEDIKALNEARNLKEKEIDRKKQEINQLRNQVESLQKQRELLQRLTGELDQQVRDLQKQIKQLKEIDLGIEEKRRDALQK